jgi:hypothetical protein
VTHANIDADAAEAEGAERVREEYHSPEITDYGRIGDVTLTNFIINNFNPDGGTPPNQYIS